MIMKRMKINKKLIISIIALIYISACAFTFLSFSLADENGDGNLVADSSVFATMTDASMNQMDRIIDNSLNGGYGQIPVLDSNGNVQYNDDGSVKMVDDKIYHIVEVSSGPTPSKLQYLVEGDTNTASKFKSLIIDSYAKNQSVKMAPDSFDYKFVQVKADGSTDNDIVNLIKAADFIYISCDPNNMYDSATKIDFRQTVKDAIINAATVDYKPVMIDSYSQTINNKINTDKTIAEVISKEFSSVATAYKQPTDSNQYLMNNSSSGYYFIPIHGDYQKDYWDKNNGNAKILAIGKDDGSDYSISSLLGFTDDGTDIDSDILMSRGYYTRETKPVKFDYQKVGISDIVDFNNNLAADAGIDTYDYVIIEPGVTETIDDDTYSLLASIAQSGVHMLYADGYTITEYHSQTSNSADGYAYVLDKLATADDYSRYGNVLITSQAKVQGYSQTRIKMGVKDVADIILNGSFRGIFSTSNDGDSSTVYTILEIEPGYPIDLELAKAFGASGIMGNQNSGGSTDLLASPLATDKTFKGTSGRNNTSYNHTDFGIYYLRNSAVRKDATADEIQFGDNNIPLSDYGEGNTRVTNLTTVINDLKTNSNDKISDYYNWTISKAKIAHALNLDYNEVKVVHMSSLEFNTSTKTLLDNYDAIFIGGDNSSIKTQWSNGNKYQMYYRYGDNYDANDFKTYWPVATSATDVSGHLTGNDISNKKLIELQEYSTKMPVIVSKQLADNLTTQVDPSTNMYSFLTGIKPTTGTINGYTLWGFDTSKTIKVTNYQQKYGKTVGEYATVFAGKDAYAYNAVDNNDIDPNYNATSESGKGDVIDFANILKTQRPRLLVKKRPNEYILNDNSTELYINDLNWKIETGLTNYRLNLYIDENRNSRFEKVKDMTNDPDNDPTLNPDDFISTKAELNKTELKLSLDNKTEITYRDLIDAGAISTTYCGPVYWKLEIVALNGSEESNQKTSVTGLCKIKYAKKKEVHLLQIMPHVDRKDNGSDTLYLCTECMHSRKILEGNYYSGNNTKYGKDVNKVGMSDAYKDQDYGFATNILNNNTVATRIDAYDNTDPIDSSWAYDEHADNLGIHTHKFGIVKYYDDYTAYSNKEGTQIFNEGGIDFVGLDDWATNWFDDVSKDYDVKVDLIYHDDFEQLCADVNEVYKSCTDQNDVEAVQLTYTAARDKYEGFYNTMVDVINGKYTTDADFELLLQNEIKLGATAYNTTTGQITYTTNPTSDDVKRLIDAWGKSANVCCNYVQTNMNNLLANDKITGYTPYVKKDLEHLTDSSIEPDDRELYDYFSYWQSSAGNAGGTTQGYIDNYATMFVPWRDAKALEQYFYQKYLLYAEYSAVFTSNSTKNPDRIGTFNLKDIWTCVAIGAAEGFGGKDMNELACYTLLNYANNSGNLLLFHDTLTADAVASDYAGTPTMTRILSNAFGMSGTSDVSISFDKASQTVTSTTKYITDPIGAPTTGKTYTTRDIAYKQLDKSGNASYFTDNKFVQYRYHAETDNQTLHSAHDVKRAIAGSDGYAPTDKAEQTNEGVVTKYPFNIADRLQVSPTTGSGYPANVNDPKMVVYYTMEGGSAGTYSSMFAADPHDGVNNYFLYQYGKVTYTGAGHTLIVGVGRSNNDERKLFINVILNSATGGAGAMKPDLTLHDLDSTAPDNLKNKEVLKAIDAGSESGTETDKDDYVYYVKTKHDVPQFSIYPLCTDDEIEDLKVFYDLPNSSTGTDKNSKKIYDDGKDILVYEHKEDEKDNVSSGLLKKIYPGTGGSGANKKIGTDAAGVTLLALKPEYFVGKEGTAAYITVYMKTASGAEETKNIRIELVPDLYDLN